MPTVSKLKKKVTELLEDILETYALNDSGYISLVDKCKECQVIIDEDRMSYFSDSDINCIVMDQHLTNLRENLVDYQKKIFTSYIWLLKEQVYALENKILYEVTKPKEKNCFKEAERINQIVCKQQLIITLKDQINDSTRGDMKYAIISQREMDLAIALADIYAK